MKMTNWRTFLAGLGGAIWLAIQPILTNGDFEIERDWKNLVGAAGIALFGYLVKDAAVTGTPKQNQKSNQ